MERQTVGARELNRADKGIPDTLVRLSATGAVTLPTHRSLPAFRPLRVRGASLSDAVVEQREDRF